MNVLFDVSRFATAWIDGTKRDIRGIYRVVWELAAALSQRDDISLHLSSLSHRKLWGAARMAVRGTSFEDLPFTPVFPLRGVSYAYGLIARATKAAVRVRGGLTNPRQASSTMNHDRPKSKLIAQWRSPPLSIDPNRLEHIDLIHLPFFIMPSIRELHRPLVVTVHDVIPLVTPTDRGSLLPFLEAKVRELSPEHWVHSISESTKRDLLACAPQLDPRKVFVIPNGVSTEFYKESNQASVRAALHRFGLDTDTRYVVSLSTMQERKNLTTALTAFSQIAREFSDVRYLLIGYQFPQSLIRIKEIISRLNVQDRVILTGHIPDSIVRMLYSAARMFIFPSLYEGFGLPPLEAMACGLPVICSNSSSLPEVVGDAGILVDPNSADGFASAMRRLLRDPALASSLSQRGIERSREFTWKRSADQLVRKYREIVESGC